MCVAAVGLFAHSHGLVASAPMSDFLRDYLTVVWFGAIALVLAGLLLGVAAIVRPDKPTRQKVMAYESGVDPVGTGWSQSQIRYYIFALLFVVFDVEAVFIFPWATQLERYALFGLVEMGIFVFVLLLGLVYAWRKGVLRWV
jgi:NADH-quinone oxidoreductase subunit A